MNAMIKKSAIVLLLCLAIPTLFFGQGETSNWYFGNGAGISFNNNGTVKATNDGQLNTVEGCATISDSSGDLLFYTDGIIVYDKDHQIMENGTGLFGDPSSTQSAIIVPKPRNPHVFYIFTADNSISQTDPVDNGLNYSVVNMSLNGGKGSVVEKNTQLLKYSSEKLAAVVKNCLDQSLWLLTFASKDGEKGNFDTYHAFEINGNGVAETSIKSTFESLSIDDPRGYLKISSDGTQIASANMRGGLFTYSLDLETGVVSNQERLTISGDNKAPYGIEFSPNGRYLYVHASRDSREETGHSSTLLQFDLEATNRSSSQIVLDDRFIFRGALQLGENGKIYRTIAKSFTEGTSFLGVINRPNEGGIDARYKHDAISLGGNKAMQGLPPFVQSFLGKTDLLSDTSGKKISAVTLCEGENLRLEAENITNATYSWKKNGISFSNTNKNVLEITAASNLDAGRYRLEIILNDPLECPIVGEVLIEVSAPPESNPLLLTQCDIELNNPSDGYAVFDLNQLFQNEEFTMSFYESDFDRTNNIQILNPEEYLNTTPFSQTIFYTSMNESGCKGFGNVSLRVTPTDLNYSSLSPLLLCDENQDDSIAESTIDLKYIAENEYRNLDVTFYSNLDDLALERNAITGKYSSGDATLYLRLENNNQCVGIEKIDIIINTIPSFDFQGTFEVCTDGTVLEIEAPSGFDYYTWSKISDGKSIEIGENINLSLSEGGTYTLAVGNLNKVNGQSVICTATKNFVVTPSNKAVFQEINIQDISNKNSIEIIVAGDGDYEYSLNGIDYQDSNSFENVDAGFYTVFVKDKRGCGISEEEVSVMGFPKFFTPNGDGFNDQWQLIGFNKNESSATVSIFDRLGKLMARLKADDLGWDGTFQGKQLPASDYWFRVAFEDGKEFKGHFSLMR